MSGSAKSRSQAMSQQIAELRQQLRELKERNMCLTQIIDERRQGVETIRPTTDRYVTTWCLWLHYYLAAE